MSVIITFPVSISLHVSTYIYNVDDDDEGLYIHDKWLDQLDDVFDGKNRFIDAISEINFIVVTLTWILASGRPIFSASLSRANTSG